MTISSDYKGSGIGFSASIGKGVHDGVEEGYDYQESTIGFRARIGERAEKAGGLREALGWPETTLSLAFRKALALLEKLRLEGDSARPASKFKEGDRVSMLVGTFAEMAAGQEERLVGTVRRVYSLPTESGPFACYSVVPDGGGLPRNVLENRVKPLAP